MLTIISDTLTILAIINRYMLSLTKSSRWNYSTRSVGIRFITITIRHLSIPLMGLGQLVARTIARDVKIRKNM